MSICDLDFKVVGGVVYSSCGGCLLISGAQIHWAAQVFLTKLPTHAIGFVRQSRPLRNGLPFFWFPNAVR